MDFSYTAAPYYDHEQQQIANPGFWSTNLVTGPETIEQPPRDYGHDSSIGIESLSYEHSQLLEAEYLEEHNSPALSKAAASGQLPGASFNNVGSRLMQVPAGGFVRNQVPDRVHQSSHNTHHFVLPVNHSIRNSNPNLMHTVPFNLSYSELPEVPNQSLNYQSFMTDSAGNPTEGTFSTFLVQQFSSSALAQKMQDKLKPDVKHHYPGNTLKILRYHHESQFQVSTSATAAQKSILPQGAAQQDMLIHPSQPNQATYGPEAANIASNQMHSEADCITNYNTDTAILSENTEPDRIVQQPPKKRVRRDKKRKAQLEGADSQLIEPSNPVQASASRPVRSRAKRQRRSVSLKAHLSPPSPTGHDSENKDDEDENCHSENETAPQKKKNTQQKVGQLSQSKRSLQVVISADQHAIERLAIPPFPNGIQHYVLTRNGYVYDPRFNTQEDLRRWVSMRVTELQVLGPQDDHIEKTKFKIEAFPYCAAMHRAVIDQPQFWLTGTVISCADYNYTVKMLESGSVQAAINKFRHTTEQVEKMWLLVLLRLAASCKSAGHLLKFAINDVYAFLQDILFQSNEHFFAPVKRRELSDSRGYDYFLVTALASHLRPLLSCTKDLPFDKEVAYRNQVRLLLAAYKKKASSSPQEFIASLPKLTAQYYESLTMHDMAVEIFIDIAKFGFMTYFASSLMNARWGRAFSRLLWHREFNLVTINMCQTLHQAPPKVITKIENPYRLFVRCFKYLTWSLRTILENDFFQSPGRERQAVPTTFAISCAKALIAMHKNGELNDTNKAIIEYIRNESTMAKLMRYVLTAPFCGALLQDEDHKELYECVWSLLHNAAYTFPMMMETLLNYACDEDIPLPLSGHAAMFIGSVIVFAKFEVTYKQVLSIYNTLKRYSLEAPNEASRRLRLELVFRLGILLEGDKYELNHSLCHQEGTEEVNKARTAFSSYRFKEHAEPCSVPGLPKKVRVNVLSLFGEGCVEIMPSVQESLTVDDGNFPVLAFQQQPDGSIVRRRSIRALSGTSSIRFPENPSVETPNLNLRRSESVFTLNGQALGSDDEDEDEVPIVDAQKSIGSQASVEAPLETHAVA